MLSFRKTEERHHRQRGRQEIWRTFSTRERSDSAAESFPAICDLSEIRLPPRTGAQRRPTQAAEVITYVFEGALRSEDATGGCVLTRAGEFHRAALLPGARLRESNTSRTRWARIFQVRFGPPPSEAKTWPVRKRFSVAERRGRPCLIASPDARSGSLLIHQDAFVYSALLPRGQHMLHEIASGRKVWLHVVEGEASLANVVLATGDGVGLRDERVVSLTAREETEVLLVDLG